MVTIRTSFLLLAGLLLMQEATLEMEALPQRVGGHMQRLQLPGRIHGLAAWRQRHALGPSRVVHGAFGQQRRQRHHDPRWEL